jgi:ribosomal protein S12 methylthiotransferase accessory factor
MESLIDALSGSMRKQYRLGTHRSRSATETIERVLGFAPALGITRVADITGLDNIGIPVVMVCRPNSRSLAVSQGKGISLDAAKASGLMEALETFHAERIATPLRFSSYEDLRLRNDVLDVTTLPRPRNSQFDEQLRILWVEGTDLISGRSTWMPLELFHLDCTRPRLPGAGSFQGSSNGLASGNDYCESTIHAVCEILERDACSRFEAMSDRDQDQCRIRIDTIDDPACGWLLERYERAGVSVAIWETTGPAAIASFLCGILIATDWSDGGKRFYYGMGCHPDRNIALSRALTEAAQVRLTMIAGSRDDAGRVLYARAADTDVGARELLRFDRPVPGRCFGNVPTMVTDDLGQDVRGVLERIVGAGFTQVVALDLSIPGFDIPVVGVVIPGASAMGGFEAPARGSAV